MTAPIPLPVLTGARTKELVALPPAKSAPSSHSDISKTASLAPDLVLAQQEEGSEITPDEDVSNGVIYAAKVVATRAGLIPQAASGAGGQPAWFLPALTAALAKFEERMTKAIDNKFASLEDNFRSLEGKVTSLENKVTQLNDRLTKVESRSENTFNTTTCNIKHSAE